jgi:hypothetical protein
MNGYGQCDVPRDLHLHTEILRRTGKGPQTSAQDGAAPNTTGLVAILPPGDLSLSCVVDHIEHQEPAAVVNPEEASALSRQIWESTISRLATSGSLVMDCETNQDLAEDIFMFKLNRNPEKLMVSLGTCGTLQACRDALDHEGHAWKLPTGGMMFVHPWQVPMCLKAMVGMKTTPSTVVAAQSLEHLLQESLHNFEKVWMRSRDLLTSASLESTTCRSEAATCNGDGDEDRNIVDLREDMLEMNRPSFDAVPHWSLKSSHINIERTFLCVARQQALANVTHSSSDARPSGYNSRRVCNMYPE